MLALILPSLACLAAAAPLHIGPGLFPIDDALVFLPETNASAQATAGPPAADCALPDIPTWKMLASDDAFVPAPGPELLANTASLRWQADLELPSDPHTQHETLALPGGARRTLIARRLDDPNAPPLPAKPWHRCLQRVWPHARILQAQAPALRLYPKPTLDQNASVSATPLTRVQEWARRPGWSYIQGTAEGTTEARGWARTLLLDEVVGDSASLHTQGMQALRRGDAKHAIAALRKAVALSPRAYTLLGDLQSAYELGEQPEAVPALAEQRAALYRELAESEGYTLGAGPVEALDALARETRAVGADEEALCELTRHTLDAAEFLERPFEEECSRIQWQELAAQVPTLFLRCGDSASSGVEWDALVALARPKADLANGVRAAGNFFGRVLPAYMEPRGEAAGCFQPNQATAPLKSLMALWAKMPPCLQAVLQPRLQTELAHMAAETCYCDSGPSARKAVGRLTSLLRSLPEAWDGEAIATTLEDTVSRKTTRFKCTP